jgi:protease I
MLDGKRIAILAENGFRDSELFEPIRAMKEAGARVVVVGTDSMECYQSRSGKRIITAEMTAEKAMTENFEAIIIPSLNSLGVMQFHSSVIDLVKKMHDMGKIIAAICYGSQLLLTADIVRGHRLTSPLSIAIDLNNAGADWVDEPVVQYGNIITSGKIANLPVFDWAVIEALRTSGGIKKTIAPSVI